MAEAFHHVVERPNHTVKRFRRGAKPFRRDPQTPVYTDPTKSQAPKTT